MRFIFARTALGRGSRKGLPSPVIVLRLMLSWGGQALPRPLPRALRAKKGIEYE